MGLGSTGEHYSEALHGLRCSCLRLKLAQVEDEVVGLWDLWVCLMGKLSEMKAKDVCLCLLLFGERGVSPYSPIMGSIC